MNRKANTIAKVIGLAALMMASPLLHAADFSVTYQRLVETGDPSPDGNGIFGDEMGLPVLNNTGQTAFLSKMLATSNADPIDDYGLFRADSSQLLAFARGGDPSAHGNLLEINPLFYGLTPVLAPLFGLDGNGTLAFLAEDDQTMDAVYRSDGTLETVLQSGQDTPFGTNLQVGPAALSFVVNDAGQMSYQVRSTRTGNVLQLLRSDQTQNTVLFELQQVLPDNRTVLGLRAHAMNNSGEVVARLNTSSDSFGYYVTDGVTPRKLVHTGEAAVDGLGSFTANLLIPPDINDVGESALMLFVDDIGADYSGLFVDDGSQLTEVARTGDPANADDLLAFFSRPIINSNGSVAYIGAGRLGNTSIEKLMLRRNDAIEEVVRTGDVLSDANSTDLTVEEGLTFLLNEQDQLLFLASVRELGMSPFRGLFFHDPQMGTALVARPGQAFFGDTLATIDVAMPFSQLIGTVGNAKNAQNGFNDVGQIAFRYSLASGAWGIALAEVTFVRDDELFSDGFECL